MTAKELEDMLESIYDALHEAVVLDFAEGKSPVLTQTEQERVCATTSDLIQMVHCIHMHYDQAAWDDLVYEQWMRGESED